ncbi:MAG: DEAD/DEAH box helicase, partial [Chloroflexota bacterium]
MSDQSPSSPSDVLSAPLPLTDDEFARLPASVQQRVLRWWASHGDAARAWRLGEPIANRADRVATWLDVLIDIAIAKREARLVHRLYEERLGKRAAPSAFVAQAQAMLELGEIQAAEEIAERLNRTHPELQTVQGLRWAVALYTSDASWVLAEQRWALGEDPENDAVRLNLAQALLLSGNGAEAAGLLDEIWPQRMVLTPAKARLAASIAELLRRPKMAAGFRAVEVEGQRAHYKGLCDVIDDTFGRVSVRRAHVESEDPQDWQESDSTVEQPPPGGNIRFWNDQLDDTGDASSADSDSNDLGDAPVPPDPDNEWEDFSWDGEEDIDPGSSTGTRRRPLISSSSEDVVRVEPDDPRVLDTLREVWGFDDLRPGQAEVINRMLAGISTLAVMPTGAGKSLTYQLPAMLLDKPTLVFSPLIALMKDQVDHLPPEVRQKTTLLNSSMSSAEQQRALEGIVRGDYRLIYVAPERLRSGRFVRALNEVGVARVVVDEAHCITQWGTEVRPDYLSIPAGLPLLGEPPIVAVTATASVVKDEPIMRGLGRKLEVVRSSSFRPNLRYEVEHVEGNTDRIKRMLALCQETDGAAIVYVTSRKDTEEFAEILRRGG